VDSFWQSEEIRLEKEAIMYKAAKRGVTKVCLNSIWGKLTEGNDRPITKMIMEPKDLHGFLATPGVEVKNLAFVNDEVGYISWKYGAEEAVPNLPHTNEVIGAYITAGARIHRYRYLDRLGENAKYCATDSVIYILPWGEPQLIQTVDKLGNMTSELRPSESISEFACGGPKN